jgi:hypothetical protein
MGIMNLWLAFPSPYPRPRGATPLRVSLVPAYKPCTTSNRTHGAPLAYASCNPPSQQSGYLTVGTPDANGAAANMAGSLSAAALAGNASTTADEADVRLVASLTDVRRKSDLADYAGELQARSALRITDRFNGPSESGTVQDIDFAFTVPCVTTGATTVGSTCSVTTTADALAAGTVKENRRSIWQLGQVRVYDGGPDGVASTQDNTLFAVQGVFAP